MTTVTTGTTTAYVPTWTTSTNLGQLTTTSFPSDCLRKLYDLNTIGLGLPWTYNTQGCAVSTCCPSGHFYSEPWAWMTSYYSPGLSCPAEYRKCPPPPSPTALSSQPGETIAFCCPTSTCAQFFPFFSPIVCPCSLAHINSHDSLQLPKRHPRKCLLGLRESVNE